MPDPATFPIAARWPAEYPDQLQLYSKATPNGVKVAIALEELGLPYEAHLVELNAEGSGSAAFRSLNPNGKIPAIIDPDGPGGAPIALFESGAILLYLADKTGQLIAADERWQTTQWLMWQMGGVGPMFGQVGFFHRYAGREWEDKRPRDRYAAEAKRLLGVLDARLQDREWVMRDYSIADIALIGWIRQLDHGYDAADLVELDRFLNVRRWRDTMLARPAVQRGLKVPG